MYPTDVTFDFRCLITFEVYSYAMIIFIYAYCFYGICHFIIDLQVLVRNSKEDNQDVEIIKTTQVDIVDKNSQHDLCDV